MFLSISNACSTQMSHGTAIIGAMTSNYAVVAADSLGIALDKSRNETICKIAAADTAL
jgi:20S proteasome alpha/beta subunit